jgi:Na+/glutamate symporter
MEKYIAIGTFVICVLVSIIIRSIIVKRHFKKLEERLKMSTEEALEEIRKKH